jgi:hypothetical protein
MSQTSVEENSVLPRALSMNETLGTAVMASTIPGSTHLDIVVSSGLGYHVLVGQSESRDIWTDGLTTYNQSSDWPTFIAFGGKMKIFGAITAPGVVTGCTAWSEGETGMINLTGDYMSSGNVNGTRFILSQGESVTVSAYLDHDTTLPASLMLSAIVNASGMEISLPINCTVLTNKQYPVVTSVTITALMPGVRTYEVYIENDVVIHVWETLS